MIYKINHDDPGGQEFIGRIRNLNFRRPGIIRPHKYNNYYYIYEQLPEWQNPETGEITPAEYTWIRFDLCYFSPEDIKDGCARDDPTFTEDSMYVLGDPLTTDEIHALIDELQLRNRQSESKIKKRNNIKIA